MTILPASEWKIKAEKHRAEVLKFTCAARSRKDNGQTHPVKDFLFQYYPYPIALLENWQPGFGSGLQWDGVVVYEANLLSDWQYFSERYYTLSNGFIFADANKLNTKERERLRWIESLLHSTHNRPANFACYGMHEWAMVYGGAYARHESVTQLRLSREEIDAFVKSRSICCTHHDAFRFFAKDARSFNKWQPSLADRADMEQPGCVHANMDLYKWCAKGMPFTGSALLLNCFTLASELRELDMRASPYDLRKWGYEPIEIETLDGRRMYENEQRRLAETASKLRMQLLAMLSGILSAKVG